jgi:hypothetical protein
VIAAAYLSLPSVQAHLNVADSHLDEVFLAAGSLIGTALALVFSLSVIAVQRAAEAFSPSITWLYRNDRGTQAVFLILAVFCILSFTMGALAGPCDPLLLPVPIILVAIAFDLLRWHYRHLAQLLLPREAVARLLRVIKGHIGRTQSTVAHVARIQLQSMPKVQRSQALEHIIQAQAYERSPNHPNLIRTWIGELAETTVKAVARGETHAARLTIDALYQVAGSYLLARKDNLRPEHRGMLMMGSDADVVLLPVYEHLKDINRQAIAQESETTCIDVAHAFGRIASQIARLDSQSFALPLGGRRAPITWLPLRYLRESALAAQRHGFDDAALWAANAFVSVLRETPINIPMQDVYLHVMTHLWELATQFLKMQKGPLANEMFKAMLEGMHDALDRGNKQFIHMVQHTLNEIKAIAQCALVSAAAAGMTSMDMPLSPVYDLTVQCSIGQLVVKSANLVLGATPEGKSAACRQFHALNEVINRHLRSVADDVQGVGTTFLVFYITQTIKQICEEYLDIIHQVPDEAKYPGRRLADQIPRYLSFFWAVFAKDTTVPAGYARDACDTLAYVGLAFADLGETSVAETSVSNICSVAESYWKARKGSDPYEAADMLSFAYCVHRLAAARGQSDLMQKVDASLTRFATSLGDKWGEVRDAYERDISRIENEIRAPDITQLLTNGAVFLLAKLLRETATSHDQDQIG